MDLDIPPSQANAETNREIAVLETAPSLIFRVDTAFYALPVSLVREIHLLPALTPLDQSPPSIIGLLNLRGEVLAVMDLARRLGRLAPPIALDDRLLILEIDGQTLGLRVSEVLHIGPIAPALRQPLPIAATPIESAFGQSVVGEKAFVESARDALFFEGVARVGERIVLLLRADLLRAPTAANREDDWLHGDRASTQFAPHLTPDEHEALAARAARLRHRAEVADEGAFAVAMVRLGQEQFGIALECVHEFCTARAPTPVPCCPPHILGQMNLRGDLLTVVDVRHLLGVTSAPAAPSETPIVVVRHDGFFTGIVVDEVVDVLRLPTAANHGESTAVFESALHSKYLQGGALHENRMLYLLDIQKILHEGDLTVNDNV